MRTLVIAGEYPWPETSGSRIRLAMILRGLRRCGPTELFSIVSKFREDFDPPPPSLELDKVAYVGFDNRQPSMGELVPALLRPGTPFGLPRRDRPLIRNALSRFMSGRYDLIWFYGPRPWAMTGRPVFAPTVLDLIDLEDEKIVARLAAPGPAPAGALGHVRRTAATLASEEEVRRWRHFHRSSSHRTAAFVVCSALDAERAKATGVQGVEVIANGYPAPERPVGRFEVGAPATILFQGLLRYPPNIDAARWLAHEVGPALRQQVPDVQIRLVGDHLPELASLNDPPRVTLVGRVPDITTELERADLVVAPLRYGSGTRLKIIEAFAQKIPVASTSIGSEGLGAEDSVHLLIGDSTPALADACARLLRDPDLRAEVVARAHQLFDQRFRSEVIEEEIAALARGIADRHH
jgi:polysaccharide biosynthesis protein PslH